MATKKKGDEEAARRVGPTRPTRMPADVATMLGAIAFVERTTITDVASRTVKAAAEAELAKLPPGIRKAAVRMAKKRHQKRRAAQLGPAE